MKEMKIWVDQNYIILDFEPSNRYYYRPISASKRVGIWLEKLWLTHKYEFRPFLGWAFGLVVSRRSDA